MLEPEPPASDPSLPQELRRPAPRPLPPWARRRTFPFLLLAASAACLLAAVVVVRPAGVASLIPVTIGLVVGAIGVGDLAWRRLLATGDRAVAGVVTAASSGRGYWVSYRYPTAAGQQTGRRSFDSSMVGVDFGLRPEPGDVVFVVFDSRHPARSAVWGFAQRRGQPRRELPWADRPMPRWLWLSFMAVTALIGAALAARAFLSSR